LLNVRFDAKEFTKVLKNSVSYSKGFLDGVNIQTIEFNKELGNFTIEVLNKYIDSRAKANPMSLHHVYEWNQVGNPSARLFEITSTASKNLIKFSGHFLSSTSVSSNSDEPFTDKANVMENAIEITIEPKNSDFLAFEVDGETVFTRNAIHIAHPGGDAVAGSFGSTVDDFFSSYFTNAFLKPFLEKLSIAKEYTDSFSANASSSAGINAGKKYLRLPGGIIE
jgi:hypothetical protein